MKNQRKFRKKPSTTDFGEEEEPASLAIPPAQRQKPKQPKASKPARTGLLSFDEDASEAPSPVVNRPTAGQLRPSSMQHGVPAIDKRNTYTQVSSTGMHASLIGFTPMPRVT